MPWQGRGRSRFTPYGYCTDAGLVELPKGHRGRLEQHPSEYPVLARMIELRDGGNGSTAIARTLNREGRKTRSGRAWTQQAAWAVLASHEKRTRDCAAA